MRIFYILFIFFIIACTDIDDDFYIEDIEEIVEIEKDTVSTNEIVKTQCNTVCETNEDCAQWQGICAIIYDGHKVRSLCTEDCSESKECSESGFFCIPLYKGSITEFNWQCLPVEGPICQGDE